MGQIQVTNYSGDAETMSISSAVATLIDQAALLSVGRVEVLEAKVERQTEILGKLIEVLHETGELDGAEIEEILGNSVRFL